MKLLNPSLLKISYFVIAIFFCNAVNAQDGKKYASARKKNISKDMLSNSSVVPLYGGRVIDPVIKVRSRTETKVSLLWAPVTEDVSHYVVERSIDGSTFQEVGLFMTIDGHEESYYEFSDRFRRLYLGPLYYRLRVEVLDGSSFYTPVTILNAANIQ